MWEMFKTFLRKIFNLMATKSRKDLSSTDRVTRTAQVKVGQLLAHPDNFRIHGEVQSKIVDGLITDVGWVRHVLVNEKSGRVIDGHLRIANALRKGEDTKVPVDYISLSEEEETLVLTMLDESSKMAFVDTSKRDELIERIKSGNHSEIVTSILKALEDKKADLIVAAEKAIAERNTGGMAGVDKQPENPLEWVEISIVIRRADKREMFEIIDFAKKVLNIETQADALMQILRNWKNGNSISEQEANPKKEISKKRRLRTGA